MSLLERAMSPKTMDTAWRLLKKEHTPWSVDTDRGELERHLLSHLLKLRAEVLNQTYKPEPLRQFTVAKKNGKKRRITAHYLKDKLLQRALLIELEPGAEAMFHNDSYGYRRNRGVDTALEKVRERVRVGLDWLVDADITAFFDSIPHKPLLALLKTFVNDKSAIPLLRKWLHQGAHSSSLLRGGRGIAQGSILSPLYCNLYLHQFDTMLAKKHIPFVRYADDFLLMTETREGAAQAEKYAEHQLEQLGLSLSKEKTQIVRSSAKIEFLGKTLPAVSR